MVYFIHLNFTTLIDSTSITLTDLLNNFVLQFGQTVVYMNRQKVYICNMVSGMAYFKVLVLVFGELCFNYHSMF